MHVLCKIEKIQTKKSPDVCQGFLFNVRYCKTLFVQGFDRLTIAQSNVQKVNSNKTSNIKSATKKNLEVFSRFFSICQFAIIIYAFSFHCGTQN